jgi:hypothetical protein
LLVLKSIRNADPKGHPSHFVRHREASGTYILALLASERASGRNRSCKHSGDRQ